MEIKVPNDVKIKELIRCMIYFRKTLDLNAYLRADVENKSVMIMLKNKK